jgi:(2Fe-2S) ferredoxin
MPKPQKHIFVCAQNRPPGHPRGSCAERGCGAVLDEFMHHWQSRDLFAQVMVTPTGCLGPCGYGSSVLVYPDGVMYGQVKVEDVAEIIDRHILNNEVVERLKMPADVWD